MVEIYLLRGKAGDNAFPEVVKKKRKQLQAVVNSELSSMSVTKLSDSTTKGTMVNEFKNLFEGILGKAHPIDSVIISKWVMQ